VTQDNADTYKYLGYLVFALVGLSVILIICFYKNIKLAVAIIKAATKYVNEVKTAMLVPPCFAVIDAVWWIVWVYGFIHIYAWGDFSASDSTPFASVSHSDDVNFMIWCYIFMGLWTNAFI